MPSATQEHREFRVTSPLGKDVLLLNQMTAAEQLGRLFTFDLELLSEDEAVKADDILGQPVTVEVDLPRGGTRYFNGVCTRFSQTGQHRNFVRYQARLQPWLWLLTRTADCKIFQEKNVPDIIKEIFRDYGFSEFRDGLTATYKPREYCVQYRETAFNFVSRLMEQEGIYYFFEHENGKHTLVLADDHASHEAFGGYKDVPFFPPDQHKVREKDHLSDWTVHHEVQTTTFSHDDYDFKRPKTELLSKVSIKRKHAHADAEVFDYPGGFVEAGVGDALVKSRIQELQARYESARGAGNARGLAAGYLFSLTGFSREDQNREHLVVSARHTLQSDLFESSDATHGAVGFATAVNVLEAKTPYRAPRLTPAPVVQGPQTAEVVGPKGEEIHTDEHGRIKVQFHWDRYGKYDQDSSCWVRVAQVSAGNSWGAITLPRVGHEVIVEFLEGDPDRPIVTGSVYNGDNKPPYPLPGNKTQSVLKTRSTKEGNDGTFNELRFEDKIGEEHVYFHAEKNFDRVVENNDTLKIGFDDKDAGDRTVEIFNNRTVTLEEGADTLTIKKGNRTDKIDKGDRTVTIGKGSDKLTINKDQTVKLNTGNRTVKIAAGKSSHEAAQSIELKCGASSIKIEPAKITLKAPQIAIQGDAMVEVKGPMTKVEGSATLILKGGMVMIN